MARSCMPNLSRTSKTASRSSSVVFQPAWGCLPRRTVSTTGRGKVSDEEYGTYPTCFATSFREYSLTSFPSRYRSEDTSELQSPDHLVCRLLLEKKNNLQHTRIHKKTDSQYSQCCTDR